MIIDIGKAITVLYRLVQFFPTEYFLQESVVIPATAGTSFGKGFFLPGAVFYRDGQSGNRTTGYVNQTRVAALSFLH
jgi:hypothetical protein